MLKEKEDALKRDLEETEDKLKELKDSSTSEESLTLEQTQTINGFNKKFLILEKTSEKYKESLEKV